MISASAVFFSPFIVVADFSNEEEQTDSFVDGNDHSTKFLTCAVDLLLLSPSTKSLSILPALLSAK